MKSIRQDWEISKYWTLYAIRCSRLTWKNIKEMIHLFFINHSDLSGTSWATNWLKCLSSKRTCISLWTTFPSFTSFPLDTWLGDLVIFYLTVGNKHCSVLCHIFFMPARSRATVSFLKMHKSKKKTEHLKQQCGWYWKDLRD